MFLLWGKYARSKRGLIDCDRHVVIEAGHPSPFWCGRHFVGRPGFVEAKQALRQRGRSPID